MVTVALILFIVVALLGVWLAVHAYRRGRGSALGYVHGLAGLTALALLLTRVFGGPRNFGFNAAALLFCLAAVGGLMLFAFTARKEAPPFPFIIIHGGMALVAVLVFALSYAHA